MAGRTHVVGAGIAGLAAALAVTRTGRAAVVYEAAPHAGGRCRTIRPAEGFAHDNGTHVLFTANRRTLALIDEVGARENWIEPEREGLPLYDAGLGRLTRIGLSPWSWLNPLWRPPGTGLLDVARLIRLALPFGDRPVADLVRSGGMTRTLIEPLTVAVLNTPIAEASSRRLGIALRQLVRPGAARLLVARSGVGADLIEPALETLRARGVPLLAGRRLTSIVRQDRRVTTLVFGDRSVPVAAEDRVILALPPFEIMRLLPDLPVPEAFEPIVNVHYRLSGAQRPRFVGLVGTTPQWVLLRSDHLSVTISAASRVVEETGDDLAARIWREIAPALAALGIPADPAVQPEARVVKERRATIRQDAKPSLRTPVRPLGNLALAGDWIGRMPATIESAVVAGERAARAGWRRGGWSPTRSMVLAGARSAP